MSKADEVRDRIAELAERCEEFRRCARIQLMVLEDPVGEYVELEEAEYASLEAFELAEYLPICPEA